MSFKFFFTFINKKVELGVRQGSGLNFYLFSLVMDDVTRDTQDEVPWYMLFADYIVLIRRDEW